MDRVKNRVVKKNTEVLEDNVASVFRVEEWIKQESNKNLVRLNIGAIRYFQMSELFWYSRHCNYKDHAINLLVEINICALVVTGKEVRKDHAAFTWHKYNQVRPCEEWFIIYKSSEVHSYVSVYQDEIKLLGRSISGAVIYLDTKLQVQLWPYHQISNARINALLRQRPALKFCATETSR